MSVLMPILACATFFVIFAILVRNRASSCGQCEHEARCAGCPQDRDGNEH